MKTIRSQAGNQATSSVILYINTALSFCTSPPFSKNTITERSFQFLGPSISSALKDAQPWVINNQFTN